MSFISKMVWGWTANATYMATKTRLQIHIQLPSMGKFIPDKMIINNHTLILEGNVPTDEKNIGVEYIQDGETRAFSLSRQPCDGETRRTPECYQ
jgi:hypothetical protein